MEGTAMTDQLTAGDHPGHCHALHQHPVLPLMLLCERSRNHTGAHTSCGWKPGADHSRHFTECLSWYSQGTPVLSLRMEQVT